MRRLTHVEYLRSIQKVLGVSTSGYTASLPTDGLVNGFDNQISALQVTFESLSSYQRIAEDVAARAVTNAASRSALFAGCQPLAAGCLDAVVSKLGRRFFRRSLAAEEVQNLRDVVFASPGEIAADGQQGLLEAFLLSPQLLYRTELGEPSDRPGLTRLTNHEIATALSFTLWQETPDVGLLDAADARAFTDTSAIAKQVRSMMADARGDSTLESFAGMYLRVPQMLAAVVSGTDVDFRTAAAEEIKLLVRDYFLGDADVAQIFRSPYTYVNDRLATVYGYPRASGATFRRVAIPAGSDRQGLFGTSGFYLATSRGDHPSVIHQGQYVRNLVLCDPVSGPPPALQAQIAKDPKASSSEERLSKPECAICHRKLDLIGKGLSAYNALGARLPNVSAASTQGVIEGYDNASFSGPAMLGQTLNQIGRTSRCLLENLMAWLAGRGVTEDDRPAVEHLAKAMDQGRQRFKEALPAYFTSDAFLYREVGPP